MGAAEHHNGLYSTDTLQYRPVRSTSMRCAELGWVERLVLTSDFLTDGWLRWFYAVRATRDLVTRKGC